MTEITEIQTLIGSYGFPIIVAMYHMIYQERTLRKLTVAIDSLKDAFYNSQNKVPMPPLPKDI